MSKQLLKQIVLSLQHVRTRLFGCAFALCGLTTCACFQRAVLAMKGVKIAYQLNVFLRHKSRCQVWCGILGAIASCISLHTLWPSDKSLQDD
eukprot:5467788-Amphidinium_carterae.1